jgi:Ras-related protein Rab-35
VITEDAQRFANQMDIKLFETSAKDNINVEDMFLAITTQVLNHKKANLSNLHQENDVVRIGKDKDKKNKKKTCC